jgi:hypothetical protein
LDAESGRVEPVKMILSCCQIHRGCTIEVFFGEREGGRIPWPDPDLKPDAERDFPGLVPNQLKHLLKDRNAKAREAISALTAEVADLREENKKLLDQLVAAGFRNDELAQALRADQAVRA